MRRFSAALGAALWMCGLVGFGGAWTPAAAQTWNDARTMALVRRATERRAVQLADTTLRDYRATAHGYLSFLAQVGQGFPEPPKVVRTDELALEVYWRAPDLSKQIIVGRRDTLLLPTDIRYHRDHLGIVQNNFPGIIRIGEGDEVRDVPHPLSAAGLDDYDFAIHDSLQLLLPDGPLDVYEVAVRPKDPYQPRFVGNVYIDRSSAQVVRMSFSFTRAAYLDRELEDITIVLENALVDGRFWLPRRQEIEIRRTGTWLDFPARGIIRGRWEICCYRINTGVTAAFFRGAEIVQSSPTVLAQHRWTGGILDSLPPGVRAAGEADVRRVQAKVRELVAAQALQRGPGASLFGRRLSDFARVNRVEGLALGAGGALRVPPFFTLAASGRYGLDDQAAKGEGSFTARRPDGRSLALFAERDYRDVGDVSETSLLVNSLAAQEFGTDRTDPYDVRAAGVRVGLGTRWGVRWSLTASHETQSRLAVHAMAWQGRFEPTIPAWSIREERLALDIERPMAPAFLGTEVGGRLQLRGGWFTGRDTSFATSQPRFGRAFLLAELDRRAGASRLVVRTTAGGVVGTPAAPPQEYVYLGGPSTAPGYDFHRFAARFAGSAHVEWQLRVPFVPIGLGPWGRAPGSATLAPYVHTVYVSGAAPFAEPARGWYPSVGVGLAMLFDLVRVDVARGLRGGRWTFSFDLSRSLWGVL